jgi:hypothetical protein
MNHYGDLARTHWATYRPRQYGLISDPETFFTVLGEQISDEIAELTAVLEGQAPAGETFLAKIGRLNMARLSAQEQVLRETLPPAEDDKTAA